ncbi:MAG: molecular chaperone DjiA [Nonlabens ulvanivorans]|uniref:DnaJ like chaperone protein n=1 Tax=Nonlabens ulvanivorans TaxID=906888 RepID=A0A084JTM9_NONUL|nr:molecular chaperone DjiA [Nonlabens ulvanivorans]KEZ92313.1 molecular chaperone DnaJ [Nonlabens ulvanivorans]PRX15146.1 DnaJ like chaperone protein [Nonlabens ulvanivorans]WOI22502.1 molecular chaperone DjiA [Nonlabens ulvanivorans]GAK98810.1 DnaJ-like protein DjlA [Nonlabens ulvanivorans]
MSFLGYIVLFFVLRLLFNAFTSSNSSQRNANPYRGQRQSVSPQDFELHLLSLTSIVIKADGQVSDSELRYVRNYFIQSYGEQRASQIFRVFNEVVKKRELNAARICQFLNARTRIESRIQILHFLFGIAQADGNISDSELRVLEQIAGYLRLTQRDFISIKAMFVKDRDNAYKILEIDKSVPDHEVKKAYRTMAKRYHPDKLMDMDEAYRKGAEEKFRKVQEAYETVRKERGMA